MICIYICYYDLLHPMFLDDIPLTSMINSSPLDPAQRIGLSPFAGEWRVRHRWCIPWSRRTWQSWNHFFWEESIDIYINKYIHIYIYYIIYKYSKPYSCNTWETWQSDDPTRWSYTQPRFTEFQRNSCCCSGSKFTWEGHHHTLQNLILRYSEHIYIYMHTYVIYIYPLKSDHPSSSKF